LTVIEDSHTPDQPIESEGTDSNTDLDDLAINPMESVAQFAAVLCEAQHIAIQLERKEKKRPKTFKETPGPLNTATKRLERPWLPKASVTFPPFFRKEEAQVSKCKGSTEVTAHLEWNQSQAADAKLMGMTGYLHPLRPLNPCRLPLLKDKVRGNA